MLLPGALVVGLLANAVVVGRWGGKVEAREAAVIEIRESLREIQKTLKEQDERYMKTFETAAGLEARLAVLEKAADTQAAINLRVLAHLEKKGD